MPDSDPTAVIDAQHEHDFDLAEATDEVETYAAAEQNGGTATAAPIDDEAYAASSSVVLYLPAHAAPFRRARRSKASWLRRAFAARPCQACRAGSCSARP